ncbi:MAG: hypothetical protein ABL874_12515 [Sphingopyxis sp.]
MKEATLAKRMDVEPGFIKQLVARGCLPPPRNIGGAPRWLWDEVVNFIRAGKIGEATDGVDLFKVGAARAAEAAATRHGRQKPHG